MRKLTRVLFSVLLVLFVAFSCGKEDPADDLIKEGDFNISELTGSWEATSAVFNDGVSQSVEIIGEGGSLTMTVQSNGRFSLTISPAERTPYTVSGEFFWEKWEGKYYLAIIWDKYPDDWDTYGSTLTDTTFTLSGGFESGEYDFDNDGTFEICGISIAFVRI
ncbi:hypothetical protein SAMN06265375_1011585 [Muriicola jejuensis]|uniref:Lipocalin-like domain-containing protein n=1 Tax=Muriicola jejuensis TaxID=504488 RepID=A0A6P0U721_9FLAO|nr:hypothetical protein [Muriicola jejuensis]NER08937.1 hypothetical protein [Muriicola jejuensis]SMP12771.1 hypothetical protein SAMN06265375_1011585 [Muriicola jejuensis]